MNRKYGKCWTCGKKTSRKIHFWFLNRKEYDCLRCQKAATKHVGDITRAYSLPKPFLIKE